MKVLVTGHRGYIGTILTKMLLRAGHEVTGIDTDLYRECTFGDDPTTEVRSIECDIRDLRAEQLDGFDAVVHLAGMCNDPLGDLLPETTFAINHRATIHLAKLAIEA